MNSKEKSTMSQILNKVCDVDPNNSEAVKEALSSFFQHLPKHTELNCNQWLRSLEGVITRFPKFCMSHRNTAETYLINFLDCSNYYTVIEAAKCAHVLQQVRPIQEKTATAKSCWRDLMASLCDAVHSLIGELFPHAVDIYKQIEKKELNVSMTPLPTALANICNTTAKQQNNKQALLSTRLRNVFVFLQAMLVEMYPVAKPIRPQSILDVIVRSLSVTSSVVPSSVTPADVANIKIQALRSLDALVACLGPNLVPFSPLVFRLVMQTLKWTSDHPSEEYKKVRISAYATITRWLTVLHTHRAAAERGRCWEDELTSHVIDDVTPPRKTVELTMNSNSTKHLSKKAKRKLANTMLQESSIASHAPGEKNKVTVCEETNDEVAVAALECAETFLNVCGIFLKPQTHKRFQERLVRECQNLSAYSSDRSIALLQALDAARVCIPPVVPPPTQYCLQIYSCYINCGDTKISSFCSRALLNIRLHLHCSPPSLNFAVTPPENRQEEKNKKRASERNRAALEALLGADKVPQNKEVITITDEPSNKKPRLDEVNISVSSESVHSVNTDSSEQNSEEEDQKINEQEIKVIIENVQEIEETGDGTNKIAIEDEIDAPLVIIEEPSEELINKDCTNEADIHIEVTEVDQEEVLIEVEEIDKEVHIEVEEIDKEDHIEVSTTETGETTQKQSDQINTTEKRTIYEAATQMPTDISVDTMEEEERLSMEVAYDFPNTCKDTVPVIEKLEDENLPSTSDTDDIQITCGQVVKNSQDMEVDKKPQEKYKETAKVNGIASPEKNLENDVVSRNGTLSGEDKKLPDGELTVEDMLADFVDEANDDTQITQA